MVQRVPTTKIFYNFLLKRKVFIYEPHHWDQNVRILATCPWTIAIVVYVCNFAVFIDVVDL